MNYHYSTNIMPVITLYDIGRNFFFFNFFLGLTLHEQYTSLLGFFCLGFLIKNASICCPKSNLQPRH
uniref:Uncharacterized protein n=1 Tax=Rhizophora mucronata TaxID=61149 RepID=A0A2P2P4D7_RHIMU